MQTSDLISQLAHQGAPKAALKVSAVVLRLLMLVTIYFVLLLMIHGLRDDIGQKLQQSLFLTEVLLMLSIVLLSALASGALARVDGWDIDPTHPSIIARKPCQWCMKSLRISVKVGQIGSESVAVLLRNTHSRKVFFLLYR